MARRVMSSPKAIVVLVFGLIVGAVWAAGGLAAAAGPSKPTVSITAGTGLQATPSNPITSTGTISLDTGYTDARYAAKVHDHNTLYSPIGHDHNGVYAPMLHNHDGVYAPFAHNHDERYLSLNGGSLNGNLSFLNGAEMIAPRVQNASSAPPSPMAGQLWFNSSTKVLMLYDGSAWQSLAGGGADVLNAVSNFPSYSTSSSGKTPCVVNFDVPVGTEVVVEFGARFEVSSANTTGFLAVEAGLDNEFPGFGNAAARHDRYVGNGLVLVVQGSSLKTYAITTPGAHSVTLWASVSASQGGSNTITAPWLKVSKKTN
jgi:hypothetical protein